MDIKHTPALQTGYGILSLWEIIKHDHPIHNMDPKSTFMDIPIIIYGYNAKHQQMS
jgi:hypothetical protein